LVILLIRSYIYAQSILDLNLPNCAPSTIMASFHWLT
jgi:hypothetical protein